MTRRVALTLAGYFGTLAIVALGVFLWGHRVETRIEHHIDEVLIERRVQPHSGARQTSTHRHAADSASSPATSSPSGGDALQPGSTGHQPSGPPQGGHHGGEGEQEPIAGPPAPTEGSASPSGPGTTAEVVTPAPAEAAATGALSPTVEKLPEPAKQTVEGVCSIADRLARLC